jgi:hypothetical protein
MYVYVSVYAPLVGIHCLYHRQPRPLPIAPSVIYDRVEIPCSRMRSLVIVNDTAGRACTMHGESSTTRARPAF